MLRLSMLLNPEPRCRAWEDWDEGPGMGGGWEAWDEGPGMRGLGWEAWDEEPGMRLAYLHVIKSLGGLG